jgi:hydrogenase nickel incorporation protein HypA/HybF
MLHRTESDFTQSILLQVLTHVRETGLARIERVHLVLGEMAGLNQLKIQSHWEELSKGTPAGQAGLHFRLIQAEVQCMSCFEKYHPTGGGIHCPHCGSFGAKILAGEECHLESIE